MTRSVSKTHDNGAFMSVDNHLYKGEIELTGAMRFFYDYYVTGRGLQPEVAFDLISVKFGVSYPDVISALGEERLKWLVPMSINNQ